MTGKGVQVDGHGAQSALGAVNDEAIYPSARHGWTPIPTNPRAPDADPKSSKESETRGIYPFAGCMDDFRVYRRVLSAEEIKTLHADGAASDEQRKPARADVRQNDEPPLELNAGLAAHWRFDEAEGNLAHDASVNKHAGTLQHEASFQTGRVGNAVRLELKVHPPVGSRVTVEPFDIEGGDRHITLAARVHPYAFGRCAKRQARIISKTQSDGQYMGGTHYWTLTFWEQGLRFALTTDKGRSDVITQPQLVIRNEWQHVAATWDGATMKVYLDGKVVGSRERDGNLLRAPAVGVCIGNETKYIEGINFQGLIDDVRIYHRALSDKEVEGLVALGKPAAVAGSPTGEPQ